MPEKLQRLRLNAFVNAAEALYHNDPQKAHLLLARRDLITYFRGAVVRGEG